MSSTADGVFNEDALYAAVVGMWGQHGAHADVLRFLIEKSRVAVALRPVGCMNRIRNEDGTLHCWHSDDTPCWRSGHETIPTYWIDDTVCQTSSPDSSPVQEPHSASSAAVPAVRQGEDTP